MTAGRKTAIALACVVLIGAIAMLYACAGRKVETPAPTPIAVQTTIVRLQTVPDVIETSGTVISRQSVEVRPQTGGVLESVRIGDGDEVRAGQVLFTIDPRPLRAALKQAKGNLVRDQALAVDAADTARRYKPLADMQAVDTKSYVTAVNAQHSLEATLAADKALVDEAQLSLDYATVRAPISGRAGAIQVKPGNVVSATSSSPLVVLNVLAPIEVHFALPHVQVDAARRAGAKQSGDSLAVMAFDAASGKPLDRGQLYFLDNAFDETSGTLAARARFANDTQTLWPGQFITVRLLLSEGAGVVAVPESALQQGQQGPYVYGVVGGKAVLRPLSIARLLDGQAVVAKGLSAGDEVVLTVPNDLRDGSAVASSPSSTGATAH